MMKVIGSTLVLLGSGIVWYLGRMERKRCRRVLYDLLMSFRRMSDEIRMTRTPLPDLLEALGQDCGEDAAAFFFAVVKRIRHGEPLKVAWGEEVNRLPLSVQAKRVVFETVNSAECDETNVCKGIVLSVKKLDEIYERTEQIRQQEEKRMAAMCFSSAALLVILLI